MFLLRIPHRWSFRNFAIYKNLAIYTLQFLFSQAGKTLSQRRWQASFSEDGHLDIAKVLRRIQRGVTFVVYLHSVFVSPFVFGFAITLKTLVQLHDPFPIVRRLYQ